MKIWAVMTDGTHAMMRSYSITNGFCISCEFEEISKTYGYTMLNIFPTKRDAMANYLTFVVGNRIANDDNDEYLPF